MGLTWRYIKRVIKNIKNQEFKEFILNYELDPYLVKFQELGKSFPEQNVLIIQNDDAGHGFFAEYRMTLNYLAFAEKYHFIPYIYYDRNYRYAEQEKINGTDNPFEYYFEQPAFLKYQEAFSAQNVVFAKNAHGDIAEKLNKQCCSYEVSDEYITYMSEIVRKYIRYNGNTQEYLDSEVEKILGEENVLGIHYRGTDFKENFNNHPVAITIEKEIEIAKEQLEKNLFSKIFLATDDIDAIHKFKEEFGDRVVFYQDVYRGNANVSVAFSQNERKHHYYRLGLEVLRDMHTLANCEGLIAGMSQVSNIARITRKAMGLEYRYLCIINQGINRNSKEFRGESK